MSPFIFTCLHLFIAKHHLSGSRSMTYATLLMLVPHRPHLIYPFFFLCCGDSAVLGLQDQLLPVLQEIIDKVDIGMGQLISLVLSWSRCKVGLPTCSPLPCHQVSSSIALASSLLVQKNKGWSQFS